jgi:putative ABC transport system permease protein
MWKILLEEFIGDLRKQKLRATLTMLAMTWGTVAVVLLLSFGEGLKVAIVRGLVNAGDQIFMVYGGQTSRVFEGLPTGRSIRLTEEDLDLVLQSIPEFEMGSPSYGRWGTSLRASCAACSRPQAGAFSTSRTWSSGAGCSSWATASPGGSSPRATPWARA